MAAREHRPQVLKAAAHAMKHKPETQASGRYDQNADTKLVKAAYGALPHTELARGRCKQLRVHPWLRRLQPVVREHLHA